MKYEAIRVEETNKPVCPEDGLILKIMSVGLCGSDIRNLTTDSRKGNYPFIYGHEIIGFVDEVGPACTKYQVGQRLFLFPGTYCMECDSCISGHSENCENEHVAKLAGTGGFAQYIAVSGEKLNTHNFDRYSSYIRIIDKKEKAVEISTVFSLCNKPWTRGCFRSFLARQSLARLFLVRLFPAVSNGSEL